MPDKKSMRHLLPLENEAGIRLAKGEEDMFGIMYDLSRDFIARLPGTKNILNGLTDEEKESYTQLFVHCLVDESQEILGHTRWKNWKQHINWKASDARFEIKYELADILHFIMEIAITWRITPIELASAYIAKNQENHRRQDDGYTG